MLSKTLRNFANNIILPLLPDPFELALRKGDQRFKRWRHREVFAETTRFIQKQMPSARMFASDLELLEYAISRMPDVTQGLVCEFGVGSGRTITHIATLLPDAQIFGFDSFKGLPEDWRPGFPKGTYATRKILVVPSNVILHKGLFQETLPGFFSQHSERCVFLHVDCDLYSSTKTIFEQCGSRVRPGTVIVFDEYFNYPGWQAGEHQAFMEFLEITDLSFEYIGYCEGEEQVAVIMQ